MVLTQHAMLRIQQRGVTNEALSFVLFAADRKVHLGCGRATLCISKKKAERLRAEGVPDSVISRAANVTLLISETGDVITLFKGAMARGRKSGQQKPRRGGRRL
jgi:hypothetical protein